MPLPFNEARVLKGLRFYIWKEGLKKAALSKVHVGQINLCLVMTDRFLVSSSWELCQKGGSQSMVLRSTAAALPGILLDPRFSSPTPDLLNQKL